MEIVILAVGRPRRGPAEELVELYAGRCPWRIGLIDVQARAALPARRQAEEAERLLQALPKDALVIALDERGRDLDSQSFAALLANSAASGNGRIVFIIGGADGLTAAVRDRADHLLAFGRATWPHRLIKAMLVEQIYRASTIIRGHPYHRD